MALRVELYLGHYFLLVVVVVVDVIVVMIVYLYVVGATFRGAYRRDGLSVTTAVRFRRVSCPVRCSKLCTQHAIPCVMLFTSCLCAVGCSKSGFEISVLL